MTEVTTAVFPVGGLGTRFLPITKTLPKEMLPIIDKPLIQYVVEEAVQSGIKQLVFVTNYTKRALEDYFDSNFELETRLRQRHKYQLLSKVTHLLPDDVSVVYVRQRAPQGLGDAILCAKDVIGGKPFAVLLADDILECGSRCLQTMITRYQQTLGTVVAVERIEKHRTDQYGIVVLEDDSERVSTIVEKPTPSEAPSDLGVIGRYILTPQIFDCLEKTLPGAGGEIQLTDAIAALLTQERVTVVPITGKRFDCGSREGMLEATIAYALRDPELKEQLTKILQRFAATVS